MTMSAGDFIRTLSTGRTTAAQFVDGCLRTIEEKNPVVNALCTVTTDRARIEAERVDLRAKRGAHLRPLEGVPFVVKDVIETKDVRTTHGSHLFESHVPRTDDIVVERMKRAGAIMLGKTNTSEFAAAPHTSNALFGTTRNPWDINRTTGGSSGGTAAAIAAGMAAVGLGTDLGGSVRTPAALCGVVGMRPTPGRIPMHSREFAWGLPIDNVHAPMARTVPDIGLLMDVLVGPDPRSPGSMARERVSFTNAARGSRDLTGRRLAFSADMNGLIPVDTEVQDAVIRVADRFEKLGCRVAKESPDVSTTKRIISTVRGYGMVARFSALVDARPDDLSPEIVQQVKKGRSLKAIELAEAERLRSAYFHAFRSFFERFDYLVIPTVGVTAFEIDRPPPEEVAGRQVADIYDAYLFTYVITVAGFPAISVPVGTDDAGLPIGIQIIARPLHEKELLEMASAYEAEHPFTDSPISLENQEAPREVVHLYSVPAAWLEGKNGTTMHKG